jgi:hypothetical protein
MKPAEDVCIRRAMSMQILTEVRRDIGPLPKNSEHTEILFLFYAGKLNGYLNRSQGVASSFLSKNTHTHILQSRNRC